jgi:S-adenosylmethionine:tRNA ribosyltransferase-isomerase
VIAASLPIQRPASARLLVADRRGRLEHWARADFVRLFHPGDVVIANDAATLPASLSGRHGPTGAGLEVRLAGRDTLALDRVRRFTAVLFGGGDFRMRTEDRPPPPSVQAGDRLALGSLRATVVIVHPKHPRVIVVEFDGTPLEIWAGLARHGRPIQYSHVSEPLMLWDTWTRIAGPPVAFEPPSSGFVLDWNAIAAMAARDVSFATITHAAGISSTGDAVLDRLLPFDEAYRVPQATMRAIERARSRGGRVVAIGTTVVRALEHATGRDGRVRAGDGLATQRLGPTSRLRLVDAMLSGTHEPGTSHYELLRAFVDAQTLARLDRELNAYDYQTHEFGDSVFLERDAKHSAEQQERAA